MDEQPGDRSVDRWVLGYLQKRGYKNAVEALETEAQTQSSSQMAVEIASDIESQLTHLVSFYDSSRGPSPRSYEEGYNGLKGFIESSLQKYRRELHRVLYPVFVYAFLEMVHKDFRDQARAFFLRHCGGHTVLHERELKSLSSVKLPQHINENESAFRFWNNRYQVKMSKYTFDLLTAYLQEGGPLLRVLSIINRRMRIEVASGIEIESDDEEYFATGDEPTPIDLTKKFAVDVCGHDVAAMAAGVDMHMNGESTANTQHKKQKKSDSQDSGSASSAVLAPAVTLLPPDDAERLLEDHAKRAALSPTSAPSALLFTMLNTAGQMSCCDVNRYGSVFTAGFADSSVRVWDVQGAQGGEGEGEGSRGDMHVDSWRRGMGTGLRSNGHVVLNGHSGHVYSTKLSADSRWVLSGSVDGTARLWSLAAEQCVSVYRGHAFPLWDVALSQSGFYFATASHDKTARLWYTDRPSPARIFAGHSSDVECVEFHPNSKYLVTGSDDRSVRFWDVNTGCGARLFVGHHSAVSSVAVSSDGLYIASGDIDGVVILWEIASGQKLCTLKGHSKAVYSLDFSFNASSSSSTVLSSGSGDCSVRLWDVNAARNSASGVIEGPVPRVWSDSSEDAMPATLPLSLATKSTPVHLTKFTNRNVLLCAGAFDAAAAALQ